MLTREDIIGPTLLLIFMLLIVTVVAAMDEQDRELERREYCEMRELYKQSGGQMGWPDYKPLTNCETEQ